MAGSTFTALVLIPLPTVLPVWTLLCKCGHCLEKRAVELGLTEKCLDAPPTATMLSIFTTSLPSQHRLLTLNQNLPFAKTTTL